MKRLSLQRGFSLIELMVAITISLLIFAAVLRLFLDIGRTNEELAKTNEQIENGRFSIQLLQVDLMHAGFWDGYIPAYDDPAGSGGTPPTDAPAPCTVYGSWDAAYIDAALATPVQIYSGVPAGCETLVTDKRPNTDVIITRHADTCVAGTTGCATETADELYIQVSRCSTDGSRYVLGQSGDANFNLRQRDCDGTVLAGKRRFVSHLYYIKNENGTPTLMRSTLQNNGTTVAFSAPQALISGVESLRAELGIDTVNAQTGQNVDYGTGKRGDGVPDSYINSTSNCATTCAASLMDNLVNVVSANLYVLVRSSQASPGYTDSKAYQLGPFSVAAANDQFKRHVFSTNVRFHNVSGRREVPPASGSGSDDTNTDTPPEETTP